MSKPTRKLIGSAMIALPVGLLLAGAAYAQDLSGYAIVSGQSITNTGPTTIGGDIALYPGTSYTGSGSVTQTGSYYLGDAVALRIQSELITLYNVLAGRPTSTGGDLTGQDLGGQTLTAGVYNFDSSAGLSVGQTLILDAGGDPNAVFIFNIGTEFTVGSGASVALVNGAVGGNVFFRVGSSVTLDTSAAMVGQIVALTSITLNTAATIECGAARARIGSVTLDTNTVNICVLAGPDLGSEVDTTDFSENELSVFDALAEYTTGGGELPLSIGILIATQSADELAETLGYLSGREATGMAPAIMQSMDSFLDTAIRSISMPLALPGGARNDGVPVGLVREKINTAYTGKYDAPAEEASFIDDPSTVGDWAVWAAAYGGNSVTDGDEGVGSADLSISNRGLAAGLNYSMGEKSVVGVAIGFGTTDFSLSEGSGSGGSEDVMISLYGRKAWDRTYLQAAIAFGRGDVEIRRTLGVAGEDRLVGDTTAANFAAHVEAGYSIGRFTPFIGLRAQTVKTFGFSETAEAGSSSYALQYDAHTHRSLRSELGVAVSWPADPAQASGAAFGLRAAWQHELAENDPANRSFISLPDATFPISGAVRDKDTLVLQANVSIASNNGFYLDGAVGQEFGSNLRDLNGSLKVGYRW